MYTTPTNLKVQIFSLLAGILYVFAFLLVVVAGQSAAASDLDPRDGLDRVIEKRLDADLAAFDSRFDHRFATNSREKHATPASPKILLANEQTADLERDDYEYRAKR